jgi:hypothetical protein
MPQTPHTGFRLPTDVLAALDWLAKRWGQKRTATIILLIKDRARQEGYQEPAETEGQRSDRG